jgi:hypothetical protein
LEQEINQIKDKQTAQVLLRLEKRLKRLEKENKIMKRQLSRSPIMGDSSPEVIVQRPSTPICAAPPPPPPPPPAMPVAPVFKIPTSAKPSAKKPVVEKSFAITTNDLKNIKLRSALEGFATPVNSVPNSPAIMRPPQLVTLSDLSNMKLRKISPAIHNKFLSPGSRELTGNVFLYIKVTLCVGVRLRQVRKSPGGTPLKLSPLKTVVTPMRSSRSPIRGANKENVLPLLSM